MKVAVVSWNSPEFAPLAAISEPGKREYCNRHGYEFAHRVEPFKDGWQRYELIIEMLNAGYEMVLSLDADAMVMNHTLKVERLYVEGKCFHVADDIWGLNDGVMAVVGTPIAKQVLACAVGLGRHPAQKNHDTQQMIRAFIDNDPYKQYIYKERPAEFNAYKQSLYGRPDWFIGTYYPGAWILQFPGLPNEERIPHMKAALAEVIR